jgi:hypothetical protein
MLTEAELNAGKEERHMKEQYKIKGVHGRRRQHSSTIMN